MPQIDAALLTDARTLAAYLIFLRSYFVFALGKFPGMKIDRPGAAIIGAVLMVAFRIVGADDALRSIDFATIVLLFAMMPWGSGARGERRSQRAACTVVRASEVSFSARGSDWAALTTARAV